MSVIPIQQMTIEKRGDHHKIRKRKSRRLPNLIYKTHPYQTYINVNSVIQIKFTILVHIYRYHTPNSLYSSFWLQLMYNLLPFLPINSNFLKDNFPFTNNSLFTKLGSCLVILLFPIRCRFSFCLFKLISSIQSKT